MSKNSSVVRFQYENPTNLYKNPNFIETARNIGKRLSNAKLAQPLLYLLTCLEEKEDNHPFAKQLLESIIGPKETRSMHVCVVQPSYSSWLSWIPIIGKYYPAVQPQKYLEFYSMDMKMSLLNADDESRISDVTTEYDLRGRITYLETEVSNGDKKIMLLKSQLAAAEDQIETQKMELRDKDLILEANYAEAEAFKTKIVELQEMLSTQREKKLNRDILNVYTDSMADLPAPMLSPPHSDESGEASLDADEIDTISVNTMNMDDLAANFPSTIPRDEVVNRACKLMRELLEYNIKLGDDILKIKADAVNQFVPKETYNKLAEQKKNLSDDNEKYEKELLSANHDLKIAKKRLLKARPILKKSGIITGYETNEDYVQLIMEATNVDARYIAQKKKYLLEHTAYKELDQLDLPSH